MPSEPEAPPEPPPEEVVVGDDVHPAAFVHQVVSSLMTALTAHGHVWSQTQKEMVARALGMLQHWEDGLDDDGA